MKKGQFSTQVLTKDAYKRFCEKFPEYNLTWTQFKNHWLEIAETTRIEAITNPLGVKLASYTGELKLQYLPHKFDVPNDGVSQELGEKVKQTNILTRGKPGKIKWERRWAVKFNKMLQFFAFEPTREMRVLAKKHMDSVPESVRTARNTLGGYSIWRQLK